MPIWQTSPNPRDVTINRELVENRFKRVTIQIVWDAKGIAIHESFDLTGSS